MTLEEGSRGLRDLRDGLASSTAASSIAFPAVRNWVPLRSVRTRIPTSELWNAAPRLEREGRNSARDLGTGRLVRRERDARDDLFGQLRCVRDRAAYGTGVLGARNRHVEGCALTRMRTPPRYTRSSDGRGSTLACCFS